MELNFLILLIVEEGCVYGGWGICRKSVLPSQFCYKPKTGLRNNKVFKNILTVLYWGKKAVVTFTKLPEAVVVAVTVLITTTTSLNIHF